MIIMTRNEINEYIHIPQYANHQPQFVSKKRTLSYKTNFEIKRKTKRTKD